MTPNEELRVAVVASVLDRGIREGSIDPVTLAPRSGYWLSDTLVRVLLETPAGLLTEARRRLAARRAK